MPGAQRTTAWLVERWRPAHDGYVGGVRGGRRKGGEVAATAEYVTGIVGAGGEKKNKMGMGMGLAVLVMAGVLGGLARVEENLEMEDSYGGGGSYGSRRDRFDREQAEWMWTIWPGVRGVDVDDCFLYVLVVEIVRIVTLIIT